MQNCNKKEKNKTIIANESDDPELERAKKESIKPKTEPKLISKPNPASKVISKPRPVTGEKAPARVTISKKDIDSDEEMIAVKIP